MDAQNLARQLLARHSGRSDAPTADAVRPALAAPVPTARRRSRLADHA